MIKSKIIVLEDGNDGYGYIIMQFSSGIVYLFAWSPELSKKIKLTFKSIEHMKEKAYIYLNSENSLSEKNKILKRAFLNIKN